MLTKENTLTFGRKEIVMKEDTTEKHLLNAITKGDKTAFVNLMELHKSSLYRTASAILHNTEDVADAMQECYLAAYKNLNKLKNPKYFKTWLTRILIRKCFDILAHNRTIAEFTESATLDKESFYEEPYFSTNKEKFELPDDLLPGIRDEDRLVLNLYYGMEFSVKEIAEILTIREGTVKSRLSRSREKVKENYINHSEGGCYNEL